jgi:hypothetical protein
MSTKRLLTASSSSSRWREFLAVLGQRLRGVDQGLVIGAQRGAQGLVDPQFLAQQVQFRPQRGVLAAQFLADVCRRFGGRLEEVAAHDAAYDSSFAQKSTGKRGRSGKFSKSFFLRQVIGSRRAG